VADKVESARLVGEKDVFQIGHGQGALLHDNHLIDAHGSQLLRRR